MGSTTKWMMGAALAAGVAGMGAVPAQAVQFGIYIGAGAPEAYVPPCPGPGYAWMAGYWANGYWVPGYWNYEGMGPMGGYDDWNRGPYFEHRGFEGRWGGEDRFRGERFREDHFRGDRFRR